MFAALLVALLVAAQEILFRTTFPVPEVAGFNRIHYQILAWAHPDLRETLRRGLVYDRLLLESRPDGFSEIHRLNLYGFRGEDFAIDPPVDRRRILLIGDSVTEGQGAPEPSTIAAELTRLTAGDDTRSEIINLGVIGASLPHLTALARDAIPLLKPETVVLILYANDLPAPPYPTALDSPGPTFQRRQVSAWHPRSVELIERLSRHEPIYRRWPHPPIRFFQPVPDPSNPRSGSIAPPRGLDPAMYRLMMAGILNPFLKEQSDAMPGMLAHDFANGGSPIRFLARMDELCRAAGTHLVVAYVPFSGVVHPRYATSLVKLGMPPDVAAALSEDPAYRRQNRFLAELCAALELPLVDATDDLMRAEQDGVPQYWMFDTHPRPIGYATIARRIHRALEGDTPP